MNKIVEQAFTLIELLVVIAIIGIISSLIIVSMNGTTEKATIAKSQTFSSSLRNALMTNTISQYNFNDIPDAKVGTTPVAADIKDSWGSNNGTSVGGNPIIRSGTDFVTGKCVEFSGVLETTCPTFDDYLMTQHAGFPVREEPVTLEAWVKLKSMFSYTIVIFGKSWNDQSGIGIDSGSFSFGTYGGATYHPYRYTRSGITLNKWYHVVGTYGNSIAKICVNSDCQTYTGAIGANSHNEYYDIIMGATASGYYHLNGFIDDTRLYKEALPVSQIKQNYFTGLNNLLIAQGINEEEYISRITDLKSYSASK
jgi:prepilin-type N-terminal cleavage/methylation domain-containing protein